MLSSKIRKLSIGIVFSFLTIAVLVQWGAHRRLLRWGLQVYLGEILHSRVAIGKLQGGFLSGINLKDVRLYSSSGLIPLLSVDEIATDFHLLGSVSTKKECILTGPKIFLQECVSTLQVVSFPLERALVFLPRGKFWLAAKFAILDGAIFESANRKDNVLLSDLSGSVAPAGNQQVEFFLGTSKTSTAQNRLSVYGTVHASRASSNVDFSLDLARLENLNLFLRSFHVLKGTVHVEGKVRSGRLETAQMEFRGVELFLPSDKRVLKNLQGKVSTNDKFVSLRDCKVESEGFSAELGGDAQRIVFRRGRVDLERFLAKARVTVDRLSRDPIDLDIQTSATVFYRHPRTLTNLQWNKELLQSLSLLEGRLGVNKTVDLDFQAKYAPGMPFALDYKILSLDFEKLKRNWFGDKLGSLFRDAKILGEGRAECQWDRMQLTGALDWDGSKMPYRFLWSQRQVKLEEFRIDEATLLLGKVDLDDRNASELVFHFENENLSRLVRALGQDRKTSMTGKFTGTLQLKGDLLDPAIAGAIDVKNGMLKGVPFREGNIRLIGRFPKIHLDQSVIFLQKNMPVTLNGTIDLSEKDVFKNVTSQMQPSLQKAVQ